MKNSKPIIEVNNVTKEYKYGEILPYYTIRESFQEYFNSLLKNSTKEKKRQKNTFQALKKLTFTVNEGEILGIIGANGAGKSTLLKVLSKITPPTRGEIKIRGRVGSLLEVGTGFHPELTGRENIYLNGAILGMSRKEISQKFDEIVEFAEIEKFLDTPVKRYSSGMYVRLAFSVAAHLDPEILLVDEVLSVGDIVFQKKSLGKMQDIAKSGRTILFVSHSLGTIRNLCDRVILIDKGRIASEGEPDEVIKKYSQEGVGTISPSKTYVRIDNSEGQINKITLLNRKKQKTTSLKLGEKSYAQIDFIIRKDLVNTDVGFMISQMGGALWIGLDTDADPGLLLLRKKGKYKKLVELPTHVLMPGHYHLGPSMGYVGAGPIDRHYYDGIDFEVLDVSINEKHRIQRKEKGGVISFIKEWQDL